MTLSDLVQNLLLEVKKASKYASEALSSAPDGSLKTRVNQGKVRYFHRIGSESEGRYLGQNSVSTIKALEEKKYYSEVLKTANSEINDLEKIEKILKGMADYKSVFLGIPFEKRHLIAPYEPVLEIPEEVFRAFNKMKVNDGRLITQNGEHVRSKSELIIADRLKAAGVSYYYEDPLILAEKKEEQTVFQKCFYLHPDFRVKNVRTGRQYYWEHFGMLDNQEYCESCQIKLETYAQHGYFPGENLIITSESSTHGLNLEYIDCLIDRYLK